MLKTVKSTSTMYSMT